MSKFVYIIILLSLACNFKGSEKNNSIPQITLSDAGLSIFIFINTECPICQKYQGTFRRLIHAYGKECKLHFVFPGHQSDAEIKSFCDYDSIPKECIVKDLEMKISKAFGAKVTPQAIIFKNKELQYSGKIDDRFESINSHKPKASINYIENALISLQKNEPVEIQKTKPVGCFIESD